MSQITSHVLDTSIGKPAEGIAIALFALAGSSATQLASAQTDSDGRVSSLLGSDVVLDAGHYKLRFELDAYFTKHATNAFYPYAEIVFEVAGGGQHYHVPLLLNPFVYSTYRGS